MGLRVPRRDGIAIQEVREGLRFEGRDEVERTAHGGHIRIRASLARRFTRRALATEVAMRRSSWMEVRGEHGG